MLPVDTFNTSSNAALTAPLMGPLILDGTFGSKMASLAPLMVDAVMSVPSLGLGDLFCGNLVNEGFPNWHCQ